MLDLKKKIDEIEKNKSTTISGLGQSEKAFVAGLFSSKALIVVPTLDGIDVYVQTLESLGKRVLVLEEKLPLLFGVNERLSKNYKKYYQVLSCLVARDFDVLLISPNVFFQKLPSPQFVKSRILNVKIGDKIDLNSFTKTLVSMGYTRCEIVCAEGDFALRGDVLDVFAIGNSKPFRISFFDDEIEEIDVFDESTFEIVEKIKTAKIFCCSFFDKNIFDSNQVVQKIEDDLKKLKLADESMVRISGIVSTQIECLKEQSQGLSPTFFLPFTDYFSSSILDFFDKNDIVVFDEPKLVADKMLIVQEENISSFLQLSLKGEFLPTHMQFYFDKKDCFEKLGNFRLVAFSRLISQNKIFKSENLQNFVCPQSRKYVGKIFDLVQDAKNWIKNKNTIVLCAGNDLMLGKLKNAFEDQSVLLVQATSIDQVEQGKVNVVLQGIPFSCNFEMEKFVVVGHRDLNSKQVLTSFSKKNNEEPRFLPAVGEYVVHQVHGVGKCLGIKNLKLTSAAKDYIVIEYKDGDILYLPSENADMISKFLGENDPKLNKIGGTEFFKIKQKVKNSIRELTFDLIKVYGERKNSKGFVYSKDGYLQEAFEGSFAHSYTVDQENALKEIKQDMESKKIMDRLLCGDVGFGKTEVALACAFKAIQDGKQVAFVCPTTILSEQHFATAVARMKDFFVRVEVINRFKTKKEQEKILKDLAEGKIDLIVGTHRLFAKDVKFKDLGLVVVDEEQRFGVEHKDRLKSIKKTVDVLSLSATPIPRTLYMSLSGIRDVSFLSTPPKERKHIQTNVIDYSDSLLVDACQKELARGGQVLIVYNRVETIAQFCAHVRSLLPNAKVDFAHGQMTSKMLEDAIYRLYSKQTQVLVSTVLIENGIDLPLANTLFVVDSDKLGLAQLYQLRGRIGRSNVEAYAYFSFNGSKALTVDSYKRLDAIMEFSDFGSGYKVALRDLEIRGAGDVLGRLQHGHMQQVGYDMYMKLLAEVVGEMKGQKQQEEKEIKLDFSLPAFVPENYISSAENRIVFYTAVSKICTKSSLDDFVQKTISTYGNMPKPVLELCRVGLVKNLGQQVFAKSIVLGDFGCKIVFYEDVKSSPIFAFLQKETVDFVLDDEKLPIIVLKKQKDAQTFEEKLIELLQKMVAFKNC